jgi:hypothetical protein
MSMLFGIIVIDDANPSFVAINLDVNRVVSFRHFCNKRTFTQTPTTNVDQLFANRRLAV